MNFLPFAFFGLLLGCICAYIYEKGVPKLTKRKELVISQYKLHHSLYGILLILISFREGFTPEIRTILIFTGVGVILEHCLTGGGLDFITKDRR